jgi:beta-glucosidase/6-phospho-beta-glucosidase/beta-galactosidase
MRLHQLFCLVEAMQQQFARAPVWPRGLYYVLRNLQRMFPGQEIVVVENGCPEREDGLTREAYLRRHVAQVLKARQRGVNVGGYLCWSITTTPEWGLDGDAACDFGLYHIDLERDAELRRQPTPSAEEYRRIIEWAGTVERKTGVVSPRAARAKVAALVHGGRERLPERELSGRPQE